MTIEGMYSRHTHGVECLYASTYNLVWLRETTYNLTGRCVIFYRYYLNLLHYLWTQDLVVAIQAALSVSFSRWSGIHLDEPGRSFPSGALSSLHCSLAANSWLDLVKQVRQSSVESCRQRDVLSRESYRQKSHLHSPLPSVSPGAPARRVLR